VRRSGGRVGYETRSSVPRAMPRLALLTLITALVVLGCPGQKPPSSAGGPSRQGSEEPLSWKVSKSGLGFRLSNAEDEADHPRERPKTQEAPLSAADTKKLLARLPALKPEPDDEKEFAQRAKSIPAPRPGKTVTEAFPPPVAAPPVTTPPPGALKIERRQPEGAVPLAPYLSLTFTHPMVAVTSVDALKEHPPVRLVPEPPGTWQWLGTRTLLFKPEGRFPMATDYAVDVPAGTKAQNGAALASATSWKFQTPAVTLKTGHPRSSSEPLEPLVFIEVDQSIEPAAFMKSVELASQSGVVPIRVASTDEVEANQEVRSLVQRAEKGRWVAFRPAAPLKTATAFTVRIKAGAPSAEGPKKTEREQTFSFTTHGPLRVTRAGCNHWRDGKDVCVPLAPMFIEFSNPIEVSKLDPSMVSISPDVPGLKVEAYGQQIVLRGKTKGRTKYTVSLAEGVSDVHRQTLGRSAPVVIEVGPADPALFDPRRDMVVLDPGQKARTYDVHSINEPQLHVRVYGVRPEDWPRYMAFHQEWERPRKIAPPGALIVDRVITPKKAPDELVTTPIDLGPALRGGLGQAIVVVEPTRAMPKGRFRPELHVWVQSTEIGLDAIVEQDHAVGWATRLANGAPLEGVEVQLLGAASARTDAQGLARVPLDKPGTLFVGRKGNDVVLVPPAWFGHAFERTARSDVVRWFVFDDRGMYKPGEEVHVKGWVRQDSLSRGGDLGAIADVEGKQVSYRVRDPRGAEIGSGSAQVDAHGGFDFAFKLPANAKLGHASIGLTLPALGIIATSTHSFRIEEFRRPEFEVTATTDEGPHFVGKYAVATLKAAYYAGGGLPDAPVEWRVTRDDATFRPPNRSEYHFGPERFFFEQSEDRKKSETWTAKTSAQGHHRLRIDFEGVEPSYPMSLAIQGTVTDVNRQAWTGRTQLLVHPSNTYVGLKVAKNFVRAGENIDVDFAVVDIDGKPATAKTINVKAARLELVRAGNTWEEQPVGTQTCDPPGNRCSFPTRQGGRWRVWAIVTDEHGRKNQTTMSVWVMGDDVPKDRSLKGDVARVILDKDGYEPGALADVLVVAPFAPAEGLMTVERQGIVHVERFRTTTRTHALKVKLGDDLVPGATVSVRLVGEDAREDAKGSPDPKLPPRPAFAKGQARARVLTTKRKLTVSAVAKREVLEPGATTQIDVDVKDPSGRPAADAEVAVVVVDEAVLALSGYKTPDPLAALYPDRAPGTSELGMRSRVLLAEPDFSSMAATVEMTDSTVRMGARAAEATRGGLAKAQAPLMAPGAPPPAPPPPPPRAEAEPAKKDVVGESTSAIEVRSSFGALALFAPRVITDAKGHAVVPVKVPDNLTRYRVMAVAATKGREVGSNESTITARLPLMVRASPPRFLNFGDAFELPIVLQNQTDQPLEAGVVVRATNAVIDEAAKRVRVPANDRVEVRFGTKAAKAGTARFQIGASSGTWADASQVEVPVYTPATTEAFATYGEIDDGAVGQPVKMPPNVFPQFGGLEITTSSTQLQALTDAVIYLVRYPFECNEQLASRVITIAALRDVLGAFKSKDLPPPAELTASMKSDFAKLARRQHPTGGWGFWQEEPWPYLTVHVAHALARAKEKAYEPPQEMIARALGYLRAIESHIPAWYGPDARRAISAYSLYVRRLLKDADAAKARKLIADAGGVDKIDIEAIGWLWPTISGDPASAAENEAIRRHVANRVTETAGAAHFVSGYKDSNWVLLHSDRRADGVLLEALIGDQKDSSLVPKLVNGLLGHRKAGRWANTQENAFVLLALDRYFATYEKTTPDFVARVWLGERFAGEHAFKGRTTEYAHTAIPMSFLAASAKEQSLVIAKNGPGRLYFRVGMQYAPTDLKLPPADYGFVVSRVYEGADAKDDVRREPDGTWRVKAGARVRVRVSMVAPARRYHVALVDPIPAGLEPLNPSLAVTGEIPKDPSAAPKTMWSRTWYEHQNMRDERVEAFASLLWDGVWEYTYVARATTPGRFVVPPAKAEEMYSPETFGRSAGDRLLVE
jgi:alpha-2-macroglobulin